MRNLVRRSASFFFWTALAGLALRLLFVFAAPQITDDSRVYADIAKNWLAHHVYGLTDAGRVVPTYIRLPGYPAFLAFVFAIFGQDNFRAVLLIQTLFDLASCFVIADLTRRIFGGSTTGQFTTETQRLREEAKSGRATKAAFLLAAVCPFLANYAAAALTETLEVFFTAFALDFAVAGLNASCGETTGTRTNSASIFLKRKVLPWVACGLSIAAAILLRPDGGLVLAAVAIFIAICLFKAFGRRARDSRTPKPSTLLWAGALTTIFALAPLVPWTLRNLRTMHEFQPLAPRYANNPGDYVPMGFNRWVKTWMADYVSVQEIYWQEPGEPIDPTKLPERAFDSEEQKQRTIEVLNWYNQVKDIDPELDAQFAELAGERIHSHPLRYYLGLPILRIADMWLRPRTELLPADPRWWEFNDDRKWSVLAVGFGLINLIYVGLAVAGSIRDCHIRWLGLLLVFLVVRSAFLCTLENPEPRYTLECFPALIVLAAAALARVRS